MSLPSAATNDRTQAYGPNKITLVGGSSCQCAGRGQFGKGGSLQNHWKPRERRKPRDDMFETTPFKIQLISSISGETTRITRCNFRKLPLIETTPFQRFDHGVGIQNDPPPSPGLFSHNLTCKVRVHAGRLIRQEWF